MLASSVRPAGIVQERPQTEQERWEAIRTEIINLDQQETRAAFRVGDIVNEVEERWGEQRIQTLSTETGISPSVLKQRRWVSGKIPAQVTQEDRILPNPLREMPFSYAHFRKLAGTKDPEHWAEQALAGGDTGRPWTAEQLGIEIQKAGDHEAQATGRLCIGCEQPLPPPSEDQESEVVSFTIGRNKRAHLCNVGCARDYFELLIQDRLQGADPETNLESSDEE